MSDLKRFGVSIEEELLEKFDELNKNRYSNRSEAIRDLIRTRLLKEEYHREDRLVIGSLTLFYEHHHQGLTEKMTEIQHNDHHLFRSNLHIHLDHDYCLEVIIVKGKYQELKDVSQKLIGLKGVKHGQLTVASTEEVNNNEQ